MGHPFPTQTKPEIIEFFTGQSNKDTNSIKLDLNPLILCKFLSDYYIA